MCVVGELLGCTLAEVNDMDLGELHTWLAYIKHKNDEEKKAMSASSPKKSSRSFR